jgi:hypothetical protein
MGGALVTHHFIWYLDPFPQINCLICSISRMDMTKDTRVWSFLLTMFLNNGHDRVLGCGNPLFLKNLEAAFGSRENRRIFIGFYSSGMFSLGCVRFTGVVQSVSEESFATLYFSRETKHLPRPHFLAEVWCKSSIGGSSAYMCEEREPSRISKIVLIMHPALIESYFNQ